MKIGKMEASLILGGLILMMIAPSLANWHQQVYPFKNSWELTSWNALIVCCFMVVGAELIFSPFVIKEGNASLVFFTLLVVGVMLYYLWYFYAQNHLNSGGSEWWNLNHLVTPIIDRWPIKIGLER